MKLPILVTGILLIFFLLYAFAKNTYAYNTEIKELIVSFKKGESPHDLYRKSIQRNQQFPIPIRNVFNKWTTFIQRISKKESPYKRFIRIKQIESQSDTIAIYPMNISYSQDEVFYVITLSSSESIEKAKLMYQSLPEVVSIEENILSSISNI